MLNKEKLHKQALDVFSLERHETTKKQAMNTSMKVAIQQLECFLDVVLSKVSLITITISYSHNYRTKRVFKEKMNNIKLQNKITDS